MNLKLATNLETIGRIQVMRTINGAQSLLDH